MFMDLFFAFSPAPPGPVVALAASYVKIFDRLDLLVNYDPS
jgi:hypothetical protein